jgi:hypothetical protein
MDVMGKEERARQKAGTIRPELEVLLCCAPARTDPAARDRLCTLLQNGANWDEVLANADRHRMSAILYEGIAAISQEVVSPEQMKSLGETVRSAGINTLALVGELLRLNQLFSTANIPAIPYKGPVLAALAYGNFSHRDYVDLDFALPQLYIPEAYKLLRAAGFLPQFDLREAHAGEHGFAPGQYTFQLAEKDILLELHTERTLRYYPIPIDFQELSSRTIRVPIAGQSLRTFSVEDTLVMLCVHGAKHFWERLFWVLDIAQLISLQNVNWTLFGGVAERMESTRVSLLGLYLANDLFGVSLPDSVLQRAREDKQVRLLAETIRERYMGNADATPGAWPRAVFRARSRDKFWPGLRHFVRLAMSPTEIDRQTVGFPRVLTPLYAVMRPWRLLREYGLGLKRPSREETQRKPDERGRPGDET